MDNLIVGDALQEIRRIARYGVQEVDCTVTSPPYLGLRDYRGEVGQVGHGSVQEYLSYMGELAYILRTITAKDGTAWVNVGDTYNAYNHNRGAGTSFSSRRHDDRVNAPRGLTDPGSPNKSMLGIPFTGSGTTWLAAKNLDRRFLGIELSAEYADLARSRVQPNKEIHP